MNRSLKLVFFCVLLMLSSLSAAQSKGLMWKYSKGGESGYLFGSVHFANASFYPLSRSIMQAFEQSKKLIVEVDDSLVAPEKQQELLFKYGLYPDGESLLDHLSASTLQEVSKLLKEFGVGLDQVKRFRPGMLATQITTMQAAKLGFSPEQGLDRYFMNKARYKKKIEQIETFEAQMKLIGELPEGDELLRDSFANMHRYDEQWLGTMNTWKSGDAEGLYEATIGSALRDYPSLAPFFEVLFFDRHPKMLGVAERCVQNKEKCFVVVGAGHLVGPRGLVNELKQKGYQVEQL